MKEELKPCPHCGGTKIMVEGQVNWMAMVCQWCHAQGPKVFKTFTGFSAKSAARLWNRRKEQRCQSP